MCQQEHFTKMNRKSANTWLTDMINISIESFKLLLNEINQIENKNSFIIIREDALLSKGASNEGMASQDLHLILHLCDTDTENTSLLVNNSNISLLFPPDTLIMVITFAGVYGKLYCVYLKQNYSAPLTALCCCWTLNTVEPLLTAAAAWSLLFPPARQFFSSLIDGCLKYKHKEKPKSLNYDVKMARSKPGRGRAEMQGSSVPLVEIKFLPRGAPSHRGPLESS